MGQPVIPAFGQFRFGAVIIIAQVVVGINSNYINMLPDICFQKVVKGRGIDESSLIIVPYLLYKPEKEGRVCNVVNLCSDYQM